MFQVRLLVFVASEFVLRNVQYRAQKRHGFNIHGSNSNYLLLDPLQPVKPLDLTPIFQPTTRNDPFNNVSGISFVINFPGISVPKEMWTKFHCSKDTKIDNLEWVSAK